MPLVLTKRAKLLLPVCLLALLALSYWRLHPGQAHAQLMTFSGETMGTTYKVMAHTDSSAGLAQALQAELDRVEGLMSTYRSDSELSRFNALRSTQPFDVSADTASVVAASQEISEQSGGAFDVTVRPVVAIWGFGAGANASPPTDQELERARARVGYQKLRLEGTQLSKRSPELEVDLSAVAKGYAVDRLAQLLSARQIHDFMVEVGGELRVAGSKAPGHAWRIGVEKPDDEGRSVQRVLELRDIGMATSGDYRNFYERDGKRISHTIDPRSGRPIAHRLASVTVLHEQAMLADAWATALNVLGPTAGMELASRSQLAALFIVRNEDGSFQSQQTERFSELTTER